MNIISISKILKNNLYINKKILINGWIRTRRDSKSGISFLTIYDGSCFETLQIIVNNTLSNYKKILRLTSGCSISVFGKIVRSSNKKQIYEMQAKKVNILGWIKNPDTYPISAKYHSIEYLRKFPHLRSRTNIIGSISRIRHTVSQSIHRFMHKKGFLWIPTPILTTVDTEGFGKMFQISTLELSKLSKVKDEKMNLKKDLFKRKVFLTVSGQLNGESYACALSRIYTFGPVFRAENSNTTRHLSEFWMIEPELAFASLKEIINLSESFLKYIFRSILKERADEIYFLSQYSNQKIEKKLNNVIDKRFVQIDYSDAIHILKDYQSISESVHWGMDLSSEHERFLSEKYFKFPVIVKNYPKDRKAFYMRINEDNKTVASMDIFFPEIGEIVGGSQREERLENLRNRMKEMNINRSQYWWYEDLRKYGTVPHSGFGLGLERLISYITGIKNIRDVVPFPRTPKKIDF